LIDPFYFSNQTIMMKSEKMMDQPILQAKHLISLTIATNRCDGNSYFFCGSLKKWCDAPFNIF
jgi:hypothetical protein